MRPVDGCSVTRLTPEVLPSEEFEAHGPPGFRAFFERTRDGFVNGSEV
jgi:hypothetical protein